jgi:hypothetical protein
MVLDHSKGLVYPLVLGGREGQRIGRPALGLGLSSRSPRVPTRETAGSERPPRYELVPDGDGSSILSQLPRACEPANNTFRSDRINVGVR